MKIVDLMNYKNSDGYIDLNNLDFTIKKNDDGNYWIYFEDGSALLKNLKSESANHLDNFYELLYSQICAKYEINSAKYDLIKYKNYIGVISYNLSNFAESKYQTLHDFILSNLKRKYDFYDIEYIYMNVKTLNNYFKKHFKENHKKLYKYLLKIITLDTILNNLDRHSQNILISKKSNTIELSVIDSSNILENSTNYDIERMCEFTCFYNTLNKNDQKLILEFINKFDVADIINSLTTEHKLFGDYCSKTLKIINEQIREIKNQIKRASFFKKIDTFHLSKYYIRSKKYQDDWLNILLEGLKTYI